ncbi:putative uncharacterized protein [Bacteroides sp. CAG:770]|jgi:hypothetical protein|uniref:transcriptional repressor n=1 Tax=Candidatus Cryptobacteroides bacterium TaxID=3085639 RepID=UPI0003375B24|nr:hypothetical protein [Bacteroidales bacterium]CDC63493.1 putative uncharacterized protein [Bacteroides sp. CAG:770]
MKKHTHTAPGIEEFKKLLKKHSLKSTQQRLAVHNAMLKLGHASADMVTEEIRSQGTTNVTVASVYNILSQIALLGIYDHRMSANNKMYFDVNTFRHIHLYDYVNNTFKDVIDDDFMDNLDAYFAKKKFKGYRVECVDVQIVCRPSRSYVKKNTAEKVAE